MKRIGVQKFALNGDRHLFSFGFGVYYEESKLKTSTIADLSCNVVPLYRMLKHSYPIKLFIQLPLLFGSGA